jgi:hypothetical protein
LQHSPDTPTSLEWVPLGLWWYDQHWAKAPSPHLNGCHPRTVSAYNSSNEGKGSLAALAMMSVAPSLRVHSRHERAAQTGLLLLRSGVRSNGSHRAPRDFILQLRAGAPFTPAFAGAIIRGVCSPADRPICYYFYPVS